MPVAPNLSTRFATATLTAVAAGDYADNDVIGNDADDTEGDPIVFADVAASEGDEVVLRRVVALSSVAAFVATGRLHIFNAAPVAAEVEMDDNAAFAINNAAGAAKYLGFVDLAAFATIGAGGALSQNDVERPFKCADGSRSLWGVYQATDAFTNEAAGMTIRLDTYWS